MGIFDIDREHSRYMYRFCKSVREDGRILEAFMEGDNGELAVNSPIKPGKLSRMIHRITVGKNVAKN